MGSAVYQIRATFETEEIAEQVASEMRLLLMEVDLAYDHWQATRGTDNETFEVHQSWWDNFRNHFPRTYTLLPHDFRHGRYKDKLAGKISYTDGMDCEVDVHDDTIVYTAEVGHFADWEFLATWMRRKKATGVMWCSDEDSNLFDEMELLMPTTETKGNENMTRTEKLLDDLVNACFDINIDDVAFCRICGNDTPSIDADIGDHIDSHSEGCEALAALVGLTQ